MNFAPDLNNLYSYGFDEVAFASCFGFSRKEVEAYINDGLKSENISIDELLAWYGGFVAGNVYRSYNQPLLQLANPRSIILAISNRSIRPYLKVRPLQERLAKVPDIVCLKTWSNINTTATNTTTGDSVTLLNDELQWPNALFSSSEKILPKSIFRMCDIYTSMAEWCSSKTNQSRDYPGFS